MGELSLSRRTVLSGLAAAPLVALPTVAAPAPAPLPDPLTISAPLMAAMQQWRWTTVRLRTLRREFRPGSRAITKAKAEEAQAFNHMLDSICLELDVERSDA
ncbi:hypothetical protein [Devosia sp. Naph2]|uniref:hypothetical protein n=1 Tax=Devosia polycyclovorans TaxID=3345148 RepID=UPI0035D12C7E